MPKQSAGLLLYRGSIGPPQAASDTMLEVFLVHPGGPFWTKKDLGAWSIPKGEYVDDEEPLAAALREFEEETGFAVIATLPREGFLPLGSVRQNSGKIVSAWAFEVGAGLIIDPTRIRSNLCEIEWPPHSGRHIQVPEVDRAAWFTIAEARRRIFAAQQPFLDRIVVAFAAAKG